MSTQIALLSGYARQGRRPGARNHVFVLPSVVCSTKVSRDVADAIGAITVSHQHGCGHIGPDITQARGLFVGLACNPNVAHTLVVSLGCETVQGRHVVAELEHRGFPTPLIGIQDAGGYAAAVQAGIEVGRPLVDGLDHAQRTPVGLDALTLGVTVSREDHRVGALITAALADGAQVVVAVDPALEAQLDNLVPHEHVDVTVGEPVTAPVSVVRNAGAGAQLLAATASCGPQIIVDFPSSDQPPQGFPLLPVLSVAAGDGLHAALSEDFDVDALASASDILAVAAETFSGALTRAEQRHSASFAIPRLLRTM